MTISVSTPTSGNATSAPFARNITAARQAAGYTIEQLALTCGLTSQEITALENGDDSDPLRVKRVAAALQIPLASVI
ncbi:helix-turn-helix transcriptional regulator [Agrobacterium larrymoorei]|uniref:helix-turn-helix domain-containing protein n=1 Tax=Agrobacterium larrymoorei TaxID=160699 RepID=UPI0015747FE9|nr:helix-turn-helix transcriptional regulator [Agrobacterium larrymoorei]NTJ44844.1 helix-turn-helix transcriptional regulator [Agrobacterium larrymoorei]